jgi:hypothetical protein
LTEDGGRPYKKKETSSVPWTETEDVASCERKTSRPPLSVQENREGRKTARRNLTACRGGRCVTRFEVADERDSRWRGPSAVRMR